VKEIQKKKEIIMSAGILYVYRELTAVLYLPLNDFSVFKFIPE
jgi:hypothetical protein